MDFWDVAKLMWRRWYVTVPMLLLTALAAAWTGVSVAPDYQLTGHMAMVRSTLPQPEDEEGTGRAVNPWSSEALAEAASIRLAGRTLTEEMAAAGYEGSWSLGVTGRQPWLRLEVVAKSPEQAEITSTRLREIIEEEVKTRQDDYGIPPEEQITMVWFDEGETEETITRALRRALVGVVGAGLILTTGVVIAYDAIARRWRGRRLDDQPSATSDAPRARYTFLTDLPGADARGGQPVAGIKARAGVDARRTNGVEMEVAAPAGPAPPAAEPALTTDGGGQTTAVVPVPDDATVVLPLSNAPRAGWPPEPAAGPGEQDRSN